MPDQYPIVMPLPLAFLLPLGLIVAYLFNWYLCFRRNIKLAKETGIPYIVVPVSVAHRVWLVTHPIWLALARLLPKKWTESWYEYTKTDFIWQQGYEPFKRLGSDTFMLVSGGDFTLFVADPDVHSQITTRRNDFPKPIHIYKSLDIYGKNVVTTESEWRRHRKLTSPPFTEKNNHLVWSETIERTQALVNSWVGKDGKGNKTVDRIMDDTMRLSLQVISRAGFGRKMESLPEDQSTDASGKYEMSGKIQNQKAEIEAGHTMSYTYALHCLLEHIVPVFVLPHWLLKNLPWEAMQRAYEAYVEVGNYMREMMASKKAALQSEKSTDELDVMGQLVKGQVLASNDKSSSKDAPLTDSEILGNAFVIIIAGHETVANSLHFAILLLALNIASQRRLQKDLEDHFQGRPISEWDYDRDLPFLFGGMAGAVMNEGLRLISPVVNIPKSTYGVPNQPLNVHGKKCTVPANAYINLCTISTHVNPNWWPHGPPRDPKKPAHPISNLDNDLHEFKPERWLLDNNDNKAKLTNGKASGFSAGAEAATKPTSTTDDTDDHLNINTASDTASSLYRPPKGAFIPFSEGFRSCLGRRFAQVEILAALAVIFTQYSVELAVDKYASDEEVEKMNQAEKEEVWERAAEDARELFRRLSTILTLQMREGYVPVRFVKKGEERFAGVRR